MQDMMLFYLCQIIDQLRSFQVSVILEDFNRDDMAFFWATNNLLLLFVLFLVVCKLSDTVYINQGACELHIS